MTLTLGIYADGDAARFEASVRSVIEHAGMPVTLVLLVDDERFPAARYPYPAIQVGHGAGRAAAFNRLTSAFDSEAYLFLESGVQVGPDCLARLCAALAADPVHGLAGPSTERAWNEQAMPFDLPSAYGPELGAEEAALRFGNSVRTLEPLHSLSDFCYAVRREVVDAIGAADERYGTGPCWEMDYNIRAARAGFRALWVGGAYAVRGCAPVHSTREAALALDAARRRYQDNFCARLSEPGAHYSSHCKGDGCTHFAQPGRITLHRARTPVAAPIGRAPAAPLPLVSCVMPTCGRPRFVAQAIAYFLRQDYPNRELVIAYEREEDLPQHAADKRIRYLRTAARTSIGAKRNAAVAASRGNIIAQWDDDDWYGVQRLSLQVGPIIDGVADITGMTDTAFLQIDAGQCWHASPALHRRLFVENVCGGSLVYVRAFWETAGGYPLTSLREDADFMLAAMRRGARLCRVPPQGAFVYIRHRANTWKFDEGSYLGAGEWERIAHPDCLADDLAFYAAFAPMAAAAGLPVGATSTGAIEARIADMAPALLPTPAAPLVSCIMPTCGRREFVPRAIAHFLRQDYPSKELIIIDDGAEPVAALVPDHPSICYVRLPRKASIGAKRNHACMIAAGSVIAHWDDDDWMAPGWLTSQVGTLLASGADVCGLDKLYFHAPAEGRAWRYVYDGERPWVAGGTLCYTKECWSRSPFPDLQVGEDNAFIWNGAKQVAVNGDSQSYVATVHAGNTSPKQTSGRRWTEHPVQEIEAFIAA